MRQLLVWSAAAIAFAAILTPADAVACHNSMHRHHQRVVVKKTIQERAWESIGEGKFERARNLFQVATKVRVAVAA